MDDAAWAAADVAEQERRVELRQPALRALREGCRVGTASEEQVEVVRDALRDPVHAFEVLKVLDVYGGRETFAEALHGAFSRPVEFG